MTRKVQKWLKNEKDISSEYVIFYTYAKRFKKESKFRKQVELISEKFYSE